MLKSRRDLSTLACSPTLASPIPILISFNTYFSYGKIVTSCVLEPPTICQGDQAVSFENSTGSSPLCLIYSACLPLGEQLSSSSGCALLFLGFLCEVSNMVWNGSDKCSKWGLCCDNWWETLLGFCTPTDAERLQEPGQIFPVEEENNLMWLAEIYRCVSLAVLEGTLPSFRGSCPWPFFWRQGPYPSRRSASWNCNAVVCSTAGQLDLISKQTCLLGLAHFKVLPWIWMETRGSEWFDTHSLDLTYCMVIAWCVCQKKSKRCVPVQAQIDW